MTEATTNAAELFSRQPRAARIGDTHTQASTSGDCARYQQIHPLGGFAGFPFPTLEELLEPLGNRYFDIIVPTSTVLRLDKIDVPFGARAAWGFQRERGPFVGREDVGQSDARV